MTLPTVRQAADPVNGAGNLKAAATAAPSPPPEHTRCCCIKQMCRRMSRRLRRALPRGGRRHHQRRLCKVRARLAGQRCLHRDLPGYPLSLSTVRDSTSASSRCKGHCQFALTSSTTPPPPHPRFPERPKEKQILWGGDALPWDRWMGVEMNGGGGGWASPGPPHWIFSRPRRRRHVTRTRMNVREASPSLCARADQGLAPPRMRPHTGGHHHHHTQLHTPPPPRRLPHRIAYLSPHPRQNHRHTLCRHH